MVDVDNNIPQSLFQLLNGKKLGDKQQEAMMLLTTTEDDWPHISMISVGEIVAMDQTRLRIALWPDTITVQNITRTGYAMFVLFCEGKAYYIRLELKKLPLLSNAKYRRERFEATVKTVREDIAKYADITSGIKIKLKEPEKVINRWYETIGELLK